LNALKHRLKFDLFFFKDDIIAEVKKSFKSELQKKLQNFMFIVLKNPQKYYFKFIYEIYIFKNTFF